MLEMFKDIKNVDLVGEAAYQVNGQLVNMQTAVLEDLNTNCWNALAQRTNTASFIRMVGRQPKDYAEVREWVRSLSAKPQQLKKKPDIEKLKKVLEYRKKSRCGNIDFTSAISTE